MQECSSKKVISCPVFSSRYGLPTAKQAIHVVKAILLSASLFAAAAAPALANVDPDVHKLCVDARDYAGCIQMQQQGAESPTKLSLNACPAGHAYSGAGYCTRVICDSPRGGMITRMVLSSDGHDPELAGKGNKCPRTGLFSRNGSLRWGTDTVAAANDPACPDMPLQVGWQNTCLMETGEVKPTAIGAR
jgi:hypothetical protein